jgi:prepilin-type N-terminal cleavage/methylation domain-containing protein
MDNVYKRVARRRRRGQEGFTLIELLVVIAVLAILATIVIFNVTGVTNRGQVSDCQTDLKTIQTASDSYYNDNQAYPASVAALSPIYIHIVPTDLGTVTIDSDGHGLVKSTAC